jgi:hypothetical protein
VQLSRFQRHERQPLPDSEARNAARSPLGFQQPWQKLLSLLPDAKVKNEAASKRYHLPDCLLVLIKLLYLGSHGAQALMFPGGERFHRNDKHVEQAQTPLQQRTLL